MAYTTQRAVSHHIAGGLNPGSAGAQAASSEATQVENTQNFHDAFTMSRVPVSGQWEGPIPHETKLALAATTTFPGQPSVNKPGY